MVQVHALVAYFVDPRQIAPRTMFFQQILVMFCGWWSVLTMLVIYRWRMAELTARAALRRSKTADAES